MLRIAIAAAAAYTPAGANGPWFDDQVLQAALAEAGHAATIISWESGDVDLRQFDAIFVSSTWNGCADPHAFRAWLDACEADGRRRLINDRAVLDAGFVKSRYWRLLEDALTQHAALRALGRLTPSRFYVAGDVGQDGAEALAGHSLADVLAELDRDPQWAAENLVLKPVISADGIDTFVYNRFKRAIPIDDAKRAQFVLATPDQAEATLQRLADDTLRGGVVLQPYMRGVEAGEYSLTVLGHVCTHAVRKPKLFKGDGSSRREVIALADLPAGMGAFAEGLVGWMDAQFGAGALSRARVDLFDQDGIPVLCELECVDPNTNLRLVAQRDAATAQQIGRRYAEVIAARAATLAAIQADH
ncbi:MAG: hypothetical protein HC828_00555 [Blastochloris sp.]|nr:hypothetical protein [Blastochloris sp.]